jgi:hypothetical protein
VKLSARIEMGTTQEAFDGFNADQPIERLLLERHP